MQIHEAADILIAQAGGDRPEAAIAEAAGVLEDFIAEHAVGEPGAVFTVEVVIRNLANQVVVDQRTIIDECSLRTALRVMDQVPNQLPPFCESCGELAAMSRGCVGCGAPLCPDCAEKPCPQCTYGETQELGWIEPSYHSQ